jgi:polyisoprenoid-binding protein YceI
MMNMDKLLNRVVLAAMLLTGAVFAQAEEGDLCSPFKDGKVDGALLATMLSAASGGHLYRIQQESSRVGFCVDSKLARIEGNFKEFQGGMALTTGDKSNGQTIVLIKAGSLDTEGALVKKMVRGESFFDVEKYPEVLFVSNGFKWTGQDTAVLKGNLTLRGITKPVIFNVKLTALDDKPVNKAKRILVKATASIDRADFGMDKLNSVVDGNVRLCMSVEALKYKA